MSITPFFQPGPWRALEAALERCSWEHQAVVERGEHWAYIAGDFGYLSIYNVYWVAYFWIWWLIQPSPPSDLISKSTFKSVTRLPNIHFRRIFFNYSIDPPNLVLTVKMQLMTNFPRSHLRYFLFSREILVACCQEYSIGTQIGSSGAYFHSPLPQNFDFHFGTDIKTWTRTWSLWNHERYRGGSGEKNCHFKFLVLYFRRREIC